MTKNKTIKQLYKQQLAKNISKTEQYKRLAGIQKDRKLLDNKRQL